MRNVALYIAMSLDGYIADQNGGVSWLGGDGSDPTNQGTYPRFIETVDTVILGYKTYHQIISELAPNNWPYQGKTSYVLTHRKAMSNKDAVFIDRPLKELIFELKKEDGKDIWICGGADIVQQCIDERLLDRYIISVMPIILGDGISLFGRTISPILLKYVKSEEYNGIVEFMYENR